MMYVANGKDLIEIRPERPGPERHKPRPGPVAGFLGQAVSFIFHPLFVPFYITCFLVFVHPFAFSGVPEKVKVLRVISVFLLTAFFPAFTVLLLRLLKFIDSVFLKTQRERIVPYIATMFFYFWIFYVSKNLSDNTPLFVLLMLGIFIASIMALMANIYFKVSMHGIAMGGMLAFFIIIALQGNIAMGFYVSLAAIIAGLVCSARLLVSDHFTFEVYAGFFLGAISQVLAYFFV